MENLIRGWGGGGKIIVGAPLDDGNPFIVYGQKWLAQQIIPKALETGRPFWQVDNGFWFPARGLTVGYYRISYRGLSPVLLHDAEPRLIERPVFLPWRETGGHILFAHPGLDYGRCVGLDMPAWIEKTRKRLFAKTRRPIVDREKYCGRPLKGDLINCWAVVTHSSNVAIDAVVAGIPVFVSPTSPASPVGNMYLDKLEDPQMPDNREEWFNSLLCQQFTLGEMRNGTAYRLLDRVRNQVDGAGGTSCAHS